ncbi:peptidoglycan bridge formation glycyltransferase FemA/FemB family protein [Cytobacillus massiliigabonensis]|uniref:peptidoglycan bridge formation glycyltransferase FemA/FemB family protein n=1 Tax=Cytobacillus massiliigabonensis TaxID=1871011 RepID=UPI000C81AF93|nr:peptidoglycan bridge formation glycyltransferase FemA/FemB family protein [Cytobacillus massiliigabonensis]
MLTFQYKKGPFKIIESIGKDDGFDQSVPKADVLIKFDLVLSAPEAPIVSHKDSFELNIPNFLIDLTKGEDEIYRKIHKSTRADIRKAAEVNNFMYIEKEHPTDEQIREFSLMFNSFAEEKKLPLCNIKKLHAIRNNHSLMLTSVRDEQNNILCASMLMMDRECKQLYGLYGVSARLSKTTQKERVLIGRANKYLQWKEIQSAKKRGLDWYNFGGEVNQKEDQGVNDFKRRFGTISGYDRRIYIPKSIRGNICCYLLYLKWKSKMDKGEKYDTERSFEKE